MTYDQTTHERIAVIKKMTLDLMLYVAWAAEQAPPPYDAALTEYHDALDATLHDELTQNALAKIEEAEAEAAWPEEAEQIRRAAMCQRQAAE